MALFNKYSSIVPSEMTPQERVHMCTELQTAKNWGRSNARVEVNGNIVDVPVTDINDYRASHSPITGQLIR